MLNVIGLGYVSENVQVTSERWLDKLKSRKKEASGCIVCFAHTLIRILKYCYVIHRYLLMQSSSSLLRTLGVKNDTVNTSEYDTVSDLPKHTVPV